MERWFFSFLRKRKNGLNERGSSEEKKTIGLAKRALSSFSLTHPEEASSEGIYYGRLFAWKDGAGEDAMRQEAISIRFDGSLDDLDRKGIDLIVEMGYQYNHTLIIVLDEVREPIPEVFSKAFEEN